MRFVTIQMRFAVFMNEEGGTGGRGLVNNVNEVGDQVEEVW